jgi:protein gp37
MADGTAISWTDATWQVTYGCDRVSSGCDNCYAIKTTNRLAHNPNPKISGPAQGLVGLVLGDDEHDPARLDWTGAVRLLPQNLGTPARWRRPRRIFVDSQADLFHKDVPDEYIASVFAAMAAGPQHIFQVLTKRHARLRALLSDPGFRVLVKEQHSQLQIAGVLPYRPLVINVWPLPNVHVGVSVENQHWADMRIPALLATPAAVRWISAEPLLGPLDIQRWVCKFCDRSGYQDVPGFDYPGRPCVCNWPGFARPRVLPGPRLDWVVAGGESGAGARPMVPWWPKELREVCKVNDVAFQFKQWGQWITRAQAPSGLGLPAFGEYLHGDDGPEYFRVGKRAAGRELDGQVYDEFPTVLGGGR